MSFDAHTNEDSLNEVPSEVYFRSLVLTSVWIEVLFSKIGAVLNVFHLIILTRKSMMTSSTTAIMIGIAFCDLFSMLIVIRTSLMDINPMGSDCSPPPSLLQMRFDWMLVSAHLGFRQCSAWLALLLSYLTYRVITDITNQNSKFTKPFYGYKIVVVAFSLSLLLSLFNFWHHEFVEIGKWHPRSTCEEYSKEWEEPIYTQKCVEILEVQNGLLSRVRMIFEGIVVKLIPCVLLPTLTGLLIYEMRKATRKFANAAISEARKDVRKTRQDRTTLIVIFIAITFLLSEFPTGVCEISVAILHDNPVSQRVTTTVTMLTDCVFTVNASTHCLICFSMSLHYRKTVYSLLKRRLYPKTHNQVTTVQNATNLSTNRENP